MKYIVLLTDKAEIYKGSYCEYWILETEDLQKEAFELAEALRLTAKQANKEMASLKKKLSKYSGKYHLQTENGYTFYYANVGSESESLSEILKSLNLLTALKTDVELFMKKELGREFTKHEKEKILSSSEKESLNFNIDFQYIHEGISISYEGSDIPKEEWDTVLKACLICFPFKKDLSWSVL